MTIATDPLTGENVLSILGSGGEKMEELVKWAAEEGAKRIGEEAIKRTLETVGVGVTGCLGGLVVAGAVEVAIWAAKKMASSQKQKKDDDDE